LKRNKSQQGFGCRKSRPTRARGLKPRWRQTKIVSAKSRPTRARGLKLARFQQAGGTVHVAPHAGAWIETYLPKYQDKIPSVAPHAGAWIETCDGYPVITAIASRPTRARGLKHCSLRRTFKYLCKSRPTRARGLKPGGGMMGLPALASRPTRARGLKLFLDARRQAACTSRPTRARGLKHNLETNEGLIIESRPTRARGLKLLESTPNAPRYGRAPRGRVD